MIHGKHVLVRTDKTAMVAYIYHQGSFRSRCILQLAHRLLLWSQHRLKSLHATHIPPHRIDAVQGQGGWRTAPVCGPSLAQQNLVLRAHAPVISSSLANSTKEGPPFTGEGNNLVSAPGSLEPPYLVPGCDQEEL